MNDSKCPGCVDGVVVDNHDNFPPKCGACEGTGILTHARLVQLYQAYRVQSECKEANEILKAATYKAVERADSAEEELLDMSIKYNSELIGMLGQMRLKLEAEAECQKLREEMMQMTCDWQKDAEQNDEEVRKLHGLIGPAEMLCAACEGGSPLTWTTRCVEAYRAIRAALDTIKS